MKSTANEASQSGVRSTTANLLLRLGQIFGLLLVLGAVATYLYFRFTGGWGHPVAKLLGIYKHQIGTLREYVEYKRNPNKFYDDHHAMALSFNCESIRDDLVTMTHERIVSDAANSFGGPGKNLDMVIRYRRLGAWREDTVLHLANSNVTDRGPIAAFAGWKDQVAELATVQHGREEGHYGTLLQALFTQITIQGFEKNEAFSVITRRSSKFDFCGPPRE